MDIRNIHVDDGLLTDLTLQKMFDFGRDQLDKYREIEGLPEYPIEANTKKSQVILKDFIGRVQEELAEGYESLSEINYIFREVGWNRRLINDYNSVLNSLQNANEEQADAIGFFITLMLYSNILPEDILSYINQDSDIEVTNLDGIMSYGIKLLFNSGVISQEYLNSNHYVIFDTNIANNELEVDYDNINSYSPGFHSISPIFMDTQVNCLWIITYNLNMARNFLKNRPWKQTQIMTKELDFQEAIVKSFIMYMGYLAISGFSSGDSVIKLFIRKQQLNLWRISTGY